MGSHYNQKAHGTALTKLLTNKYASLYRIAMKQKPKKVKSLVVTRAVKFQQDQLALLGQADKFQVVLNSFKKDLEAGNLNKAQISTLFNAFYDLQREIGDTRRANKIFVGQNAEETASFAVEALSSSK